MSKTEVKEFLNRLLAEQPDKGDEAETVFMLMDASIHVAMEAKIGPTVLIDGYATMVLSHSMKFLMDLLGVEKTQEKEKDKAKEDEVLARLLKDIDLGGQ